MSFANSNVRSLLLAMGLENSTTFRRSAGRRAPALTPSGNGRGSYLCLTSTGCFLGFGLVSALSLGSASAGTSSG